MSTHPACARFKFGEARFAAGATVGASERKGAFTALDLEADILVLLSKAVLEALGGQLDFPCDVLTLRTQGVDIALKLNQMGRKILNAVAL